MRTPRLIPQWRRAWRLRSVQAALVLLILSLLQGIQADVLPVLQPVVDPAVWPWVSSGFALAIIIFRVLQQLSALDPPTPDTQQTPPSGGDGQ